MTDFLAWPLLFLKSKFNRARYFFFKKKEKHSREYKPTDRPRRFGPKKLEYLVGLHSVLSTTHSPKSSNMTCL